MMDFEEARDAAACMSPAQIAAADEELAQYEADIADCEAALAEEQESWEDEVYEVPDEHC